MSNEPFLRLPIEVIKRYGYTKSLLGWMYIHETRIFATNEPSVSVRMLKSAIGFGRNAAQGVLRDYRADMVQKRGQLRGQSKPPPEPTCGEQPDKKGDKKGTKRGHLRPAAEVSPISNSGILEIEKEDPPTPLFLNSEEFLNDGEIFNIFWKASTGKGSKKKAKTIWLRLSKIPAKVLEKEHGVSTLIDLYRKIYRQMQAWKKTDAWTEDGGKFTPNVTSWLNGECWNNKITHELSRSYRPVF